MNLSPGGTAVDRARELVALFHGNPAEFGRIEATAAEGLPETVRQLLDHQSHMTVAMERFHGGPVDLEVLDRQDDGAGDYAREILLARPAATGPRPVQHGIVRIDLTRLDPAVARTIRDAATPLGRILIEAGLLAEVHDVSLLRIAAGPHLGRVFGLDPSARPPETFGRVAEIGVAGSPVIKLLEILAPGSWRNGAA